MPVVEVDSLERVKWVKASGIPPDLIRCSKDMLQRAIESGESDDLVLYLHTWCGLEFGYENLVKHCRMPLLDFVRCRYHDRMELDLQWILKACVRSEHVQVIKWLIRHFPEEMEYKATYDIYEYIVHDIDTSVFRFFVYNYFPGDYWAFLDRAFNDNDVESGKHLIRLHNEGKFQINWNWGHGWELEYPDECSDSELRCLVWFFRHGMQLPDESCFDSEHPINSIVREAMRQFQVG